MAAVAVTGANPCVETAATVLEPWELLKEFEVLLKSTKTKMRRPIIKIAAPASAINNKLPLFGIAVEPASPLSTS